MSKNYKYQLRKGSKKELCPNCRKRTFTPYVSVTTGEVANVEKYGYCDRINNCSYILYPPSDANDFEDWTPPEPKPYIPPQPDFIPKEIVNASFNKFETNVFFMWLVKLFGEEEAFELQKKYCIGTAKKNGTIFWQKDAQGKYRTGKVIHYNSNGKRTKNLWYVHNKIKNDYSLHQVFFGEHLIKENPDKPVALVESEKTAILMSVFEPKYIWLASGGANMLNSYRLLRLPKLDFVSPDEGAFDLWQKQTNIFHERQMDVRVEKAVRDGKIEAGSDILDLILFEKQL